MNIKAFNPKIGNQLGGLIRQFVAYNKKVQQLDPDIRESIEHGMLELANIELSAQYVHSSITERRYFDFMEWEILNLGTADFVECLLEEAIKLN